MLVYPVGMSTFRNPVGPQPSGVYWRRRLIVGLGLVAVIVVILLIVFSPKGGTPAADVSKTKTPVGTSTSSAPPTDPGDVEACANAALSVTANSDKTSYGASDVPQISLTVKNTGEVACSLNAGTDSQVYTITSGDETIWTSTDCQTDEVATQVTIEAGDDVSTAPFEWDRTRSSTKTCDDEDRPKVTANGASYHLTVTIAGVESAKSRQIVLN